MCLTSAVVRDVRFAVATVAVAHTFVWLALTPTVADCWLTAVLVARVEQRGPGFDLSLARDELLVAASLTIQASAVT